VERWGKLAVVIFAVFSLLWLGSFSITFAAPAGKPIVIGYIGNVSSPGTKPCMDIQRYAVEEINKAGGILSRPVEYVVIDVGATGCRLVVTLIHEMAKRDFTLGLATLCVGGGLGFAMVIERG